MPKQRSFVDSRRSIKLKGGNVAVSSSSSSRGGTGFTSGIGGPISSSMFSDFSSTRFRT